MRGTLAWSRGEGKTSKTYGRRKFIASFPRKWAWRHAPRDWRVEMIRGYLSSTTHTVTKVWKDFCHTHAIESKKRGGDSSSKLTAGDLELIETLKAEKGSISLREIYGLLEDLGDVGGDISLSSISRAIRNKMPFQ